MARVAIPTNTTDSEARLVCAALRSTGDVCDLLYTDAAPLDGAHTIGFSDRTTIRFLGAGREAAGWDYDTCWLRDLYPPETDVSGVHPADRDYVVRTRKQFFYSEWALLSNLQPIDKSFWVNSLSKAREAESKPLQLHLARLAGFNVPSTIISNAADDIRAFLRDHPKSVRKSLVPFEWVESGAFVSNKTSRIGPDTRISDAALSMHPEIYQAEVDKILELRIVFFGETYFALQIDPGPIRAGRTVDWRIFHHSTIASHELVRLPDQVLESCMELMGKLGLISASFDLVVDAAGAYHFMELNQGGLFLWMEASGVPVLSAFLDFLRSQDPSFTWNASASKKITLRDVMASEEYAALKSINIPHRDAAATGVVG